MDGGRGGFCRNPYALDRTPGGSSSGSGSAAAANLAVATIGSETDGSIVGPSSRNCLVGIKPTIGLHSRGGVIPIAHSQDSTGPMARTVRDAAIMLGTMVGVDPRDPLTAASAGNFLTDYTGALDPAGLSGARVGVLREYAGFDSRVDALFEEALDVMRAGGATVVDPVTLPEELRFGNEYEMEVLYHEFKADLNAYLASLGRTRRSSPSPNSSSTTRRTTTSNSPSTDRTARTLAGARPAHRPALSRRAGREPSPLPRRGDRPRHGRAPTRRARRDHGRHPALQDPLDASGGGGGAAPRPRPWRPIPT